MFLMAGLGQGRRSSDDRDISLQLSGDGIDYRLQLNEPALLSRLLFFWRDAGRERYTVALYSISCRHIGSSA